jgi:hypothetical protein
VLLIAICLSGCSSDTGSEAEPDGSVAATTTGMAEVGTGESESDVPTPAELRWAKEQLRWIDQMEELLSTVAAVKRIGRARMDAIEREAARQAIVNLTRCGTPPGEEYEPPPSLRTALINDTLGKACSRLNRAGLAASGHLLVDDPQNDVRAAGRLWEEESQRAQDLLATGRTEIEELQQTD